jgi:hypothetical protein
MGGACGRTALLSFFGVALQLTGLVLFVLGFFPVKPALMGKRQVFQIYFVVTFVVFQELDADK